MEEEKMLTPKDFRKLKGWNQARFAAELGLRSAATICNHENGTTRPTPQIIRKYEEVSGGLLTSATFQKLKIKE